MPRKQQLPPPRDWLNRHRSGAGVFLAIRTTGGLNARLHWRTRTAQTKRHREKTKLALLEGVGLRAIPDRFGMGLVVTFTRYSVQRMDDDNVRGSLKAIRDAVAEHYGVDDGDAAWTWRYEQAKAPAGCFGVRIVIDEVDGPAVAGVVASAPVAPGGAQAATLAGQGRLFDAGGAR